MICYLLLGKTFLRPQAFQCFSERNPFSIGLLMLGAPTFQQRDVDKSTVPLVKPAYSLLSSVNYTGFNANALSLKEMNNETVSYFLERLGFDGSDIKNVIKGNYRIETTLARSEAEENQEEGIGILIRQPFVVPLSWL